MRFRASQRMRCQTPKPLHLSKNFKSNDNMPIQQKPQSSSLSRRPPKKTIFPAYNKIYKDITNKKQQKINDEIRKINNKIKRIKDSINFDEQHRKLLKNLITSYRRCQNSQLSQLQGQFQGHEQLKDLALIIKNNANRHEQLQSLNQYLDHAEQQQNNYQIHLKFRKKALERELHAKNQELEKKSNRLEQDERLFRDLFSTSNSNHLNSIANVATNNAPLQIRKQHEHKLQNINKNKVKLHENYKMYLDALSGTNIVKWRILNEQK